VLRNKFSGLNSDGFTLTELLVTITVFAGIGLVFLGLTANYFAVIDRSSKLTDMTVASQNLLRSTVENIRYGDGVRQTNQISDPYAPSGGWNTSNSAFVIIIAVPALDASRNYITNPDTGSPYMNELVYYKNGTKLMQRKLAHPNASGNRLKTSCPAAQANSACPADIELADYVDSMDFILYDQDGAQTSTTGGARSVKISLQMERNTTGEPLELNNDIYVTLRNRF
jgi:prepilin-type N-terminal cleavage/methylation domain-containing protein